MMGIITAALSLFAGLGTWLLRVIFRRSPPAKQAIKTQEEIAQTAATGETKSQVQKDLRGGKF